MMPYTNNAHKQAIYFLAEQARTLTQAETDAALTDAEVCREAAEYLIDGDKSLGMWLCGRICSAPKDPDGDPDVEYYDGKDYDLTLALADLATLEADQTLPQTDRERLAYATECIAEFYGKAA